MLFGVLAGHAGADTILSVGRSSGLAGSALETTVLLSSDINLVGLQIDFGFDPAAVEPGLARRGAALGSQFRVASAVVRPGVWRVVLYSESNQLLRDGGVLALPMTLLQAVPAGQRGVEILEVQLADASGLNRAYALAPFVEIVAPLAGSPLPVGDPVTVAVEAVPASGDLQNVAFYVDGALVGSRTQAPYSISWTPAQRGSHELLVVATDEGATPAEAGRALYILSRFDEWKAQSFSAAQQANPFVSGFGADPDGDGLANGMEYLAGTQPLVADAQTPLTSELMEIGGQYYLSVTLESPSEINDLSFAVYASGRVDRAAGASPQLAVLVEEVQSSGVVRRTYRDPLPVSEGSRFLYIESTLRP